MTTYADMALRCVGCGAEFVFTAAEQEFHASRGFTNTPRRCLACRRARRTATGNGQGEQGQPQAVETVTSGAPPQSRPDRRHQRPPGRRGGREDRGDRADTGQRVFDGETKGFVTRCAACGGEAYLPPDAQSSRLALCDSCQAKVRAGA